MRALTLLGLTLLSQAQDDLQKRVRVDGQKVYVDDRLLWNGPWKKADVKVQDFPKARNGGAEPWKHIVLILDGDEKLRLPVKSIAKPIAWPPTNIDQVRPVIKKLTEEQGGAKTLTVYLTTEKSDVEIYRGPVGETRVERRPESFTVLFNEMPLFRVTRSARPSARAEDILAAVNAYRLRAGIEAVKLSAGLSKGCDLHALYLVKNEPKGLSGHEEDPKGVGYTEEGARAGKRSVISPFASHESPLEAVDSVMATLYHRVSVLQPDVAAVGIGWAFRRDGLGFLVVDVGSQEFKVDPKVYPIVYPVNGQTDVPLDFGLGARENPNPLPEDASSAGYPITIQLAPSRAEGLPERRGRPLDPAQGKSSDPDAHLFMGDLEVPCRISTPEKPARKDWPQPGVTCLIPKEKLKPETTYTVRFRERLSGLEKEWSFTTRK